MMRCAIYCRISKDRAGLSLGVSRQRSECESLAEQRGWQVVDVFPDNDVSAYSGKIRPQYRRLLGAIDAGAVDVVVAWHPDRLHRSPAELEEFILLIERRKVKVETVQSGQWDLSTPTGRLTARQIGSVARYESENRSARVRSRLAQNAQDGVPHGRRAFGWDRYRADGRSRDVINEVEAGLIRIGAELLIGGDSLATVARMFVASGVQPPNRGTWHKASVRAVMMRPRNAGLRQHQGEIVGDGNWDPIITLGTYNQMVAVLTDPSRRTSTGTGAKYLLSSIAKCGVCGSSMSSMMNRTVPSYRCAARSCVSRNRRDVDEFVEETLLLYLERENLASLLVPERMDDVEKWATEAADLRARLDLAADDYADGKIERRQLERITARLRPQIDAAEANATAFVGDNALAALLAAPDVRTEWMATSIARKRAVIIAVFEVVIHRAEPGTRTFDPTKVKLTPR